MKWRAGLAGASLLVLLASRTDAQQAFTFSLATDTPDSPRTPPAPLAIFVGKQLDPMTGFEVTLGRLTVTALEDSRFDRRDPRQSRQAEFLANVWRSNSGVRLTLGSGVRRDSGGGNVALGRAVVEAPAFGGRLVGNISLERAFATGRDAIDVLTTVAYTKRLNRMAFIGVETLLQDAEGFWDPAEADGGARLFVGPTLDLATPHRAWQMHVTAGRDIRATSSLNISDAFRPLGKAGAVVRISASHRF